MTKTPGAKRQSVPIVMRPLESPAQRNECSPIFERAPTVILLPLRSETLGSEGRPGAECHVTAGAHMGVVVEVEQPDDLEVRAWVEKRSDRT